MSDTRHEMTAAEYRAMIDREQGLTIPAASAPKRKRRASQATRMTEEELESTITEAALNHGYQVHHETDSRKSRGGFPDLHICGHGRQFVFELKSDRGESRPDQRAWIREYQRAGVSTELIIVSDWLSKQRPNGDIDALAPMDEASQPDLLVMDDLGTQKNSEWVHERLYVLINRRYLDCKPTIVTSNHTSIDLLRESLGDRSTSRLLEQCRIVPVDGPDLRTVVRP